MPKLLVRWARTGFAMLLAALVLGGCRGDSDAKKPSIEPHPVPTNGLKCNDMVGLGGEGGLPVGFDWSNEKHEFSDLVTIYVCAAPTMTGITAVVRPLPTGVSVDPAQQTISRSETPTGNGVLAFRIRVQPGAAGMLRTQIVDDDPTRPYTMADMAGPTIVTDADGWRFVRSF